MTPPEPFMTRICLNMIVKNEAARIERALASVAPYISSYCILDTGSTDDTVGLIGKYFTEHPIPGEVIKGEFVNFEQARNEALALARAQGGADYILLMDADMELVVEDPKVFDNLHAPAYDLVQRSGSLHYHNRRLINAHVTGGYRGVTHEYLDIGGEIALDGVHFIDHADGENRKGKFARDIALLLADLKKDPSNGRSWFYLAQSYRDAEDFPRAAVAYKKRVQLGGWEEETWNAQLNYASALRNMGDVNGFVRETLTAYNMRPRRAETLYDLAKFYREAGLNHAAVLFAEPGMQLPRPDDSLFVNDHVYKSGLRTEFSIAAFYDDAKREKGFEVCNKLTIDPVAEPWDRDLARNNLFHYIGPLSDMAPSFEATQINWLVPAAGYVAMNPSVCVHEGDIYVNVRTVNYTITPQGHYQIRGTDGTCTDANPINTRNMLAHLTPYLEPKVIERVYPAPYKPLFPLVTGYEDIRLFSWRGALWFSTTVRDKNAEGWCEVAYGRIDDGHARIISPAVRQHEKNWMPWVINDDLKFVYSLGKLIDRKGIITDCGSTTPYAVEGLRGGSQVIAHNTGWIAVVHEARYKPDGQRYYSHRFVWMDIRGRLRKISRPFYLHDKQIEFVAGLAQHPDGRLIISYGVRDCEAWLATVNPNEVEWVLWHD